MSLLPIASPFTILIDSMEKHPFSFTGLLSDSDQDYREIAVSHRWQALGVANGDYSIDGHQPDASKNADPTAPRISVERKSIEDCIGTILGFADRRPRFERELANLATLDSALVIVEGSIGAVLEAVEEYGRKSREENQKSLNRSFIAYMQDYRVPWLFCDSRRLAEVEAYRWLERFHRKCQVESKKRSASKR